MKKTPLVILLNACLLCGMAVHSQDSTKKSAAKQIGSSSEKTDQQLGKKIQQQSLSKHQFEKLEPVAAPAPAKKKVARKHRRP